MKHKGNKKNIHNKSDLEAFKKLSKVILKKIIKADNIAIFGHRNPDRDALGSMFGLSIILQNMGKKVKCYAKGNPPQSYEDLRGDLEFQTELDDFAKNADLIIFVDFSEYKMLGDFFAENKKFFTSRASETIVFDHHLNNISDEKRITYKKTLNSNCEILSEFCFKYFSKFFDKKSGNFFFTGIATDTGGFIFGNNQQSIHTFQQVIQLLELNIDKSFILEKIFFNQSLNDEKFVSMVFDRIQIKGKLLRTRVKDNEYQEYGIRSKEISLSNRLKKIGGPELYILFKVFEEKKEMEVSIRTKLTSDINCQKIAKHYGGGGHKGAAGWTIEYNENFEIKIQQIISEVEDLIRV